MDKNNKFQGNKKLDIESKKIFIIVPHHILSVIGGGQKALIDLANILSSNNFNVEIVYSDKQEEQLIFEKKDSVKIVNLYSGEKSDFSDELEKYIEKNKPDLMIFFFINILRKSIKKNLYPDIPKILMHHSRPDIYYKTSGWFKKRIVKKLAKFNNFYCHILFDSFKSYIDKLFKVPCFAVPNIVKQQENHINTDIENKKIIYLSRVDSQKGHKFLIKSFSLIAQKYPEWTLHIYGEYQPEKIKEELEKLIKKYKLENQVFLHGVTVEPIKKMSECDFCVFPSFYEGFGLGLAEALSVGLPSVGLKECSGVNELIIDNYNGFLTDKKEKEFAQKMEILITDKNLRSKMSKNAIASVEKYKPEEVSSKWVEIINSILKKEENK